jgi:hypothetical protein
MEKQNKKRGRKPAASPADIVEIRRLYKETDLKPAGIARALKLSPGVVHAVLDRRGAYCDAGPYVRVIDTLCDGWQALIDGEGNPVLYATEAEAEEDIRDDFDELNRARIAGGAEPDGEPEEFAIPLSEYIPGRKAIFTGGNPPGYITGADE